MEFWFRFMCFELISMIFELIFICFGFKFLNMLFSCILIY